MTYSVAHTCKHSRDYNKIANSSNKHTTTVNNHTVVNSPPVPLDFVTPVPLDFVNNEAGPITSIHSTMMAIIPIAATLRAVI